MSIGTSRLLAFVALLMGCQASVPERPANAIAIGALLPFTGATSGAGETLERSILMVAEQINAAGGIAGRPLWIESRDTHSNVDVGLAAGQDLIDKGVSAVIGPEEPDLAVAMIPVLNRAQVPMISVGASSPPAGLQFSSYWFRIVPTGTVLGQALAERMHSDRVQSPAMIFVNDEYGRAMATAIKAQFEKSGGSFSLVTSFEPGFADLSPVLRRLLAVQQDGVVLVTYPASASSIIAAIPEMAGRSARFYLTPSLRSEVFLQNVIPSQVEGAVGVSAALPADASAFASTFAARWSGEQPIVGDYFYFDATAVVALALQAAAVAVGPSFSPRDVQKKISPVTSPGGLVVTWEELVPALSELRGGKAVVYRGASGPLGFDDSNNVAQPLIQLWKIQNGQIIPD